MTKQKSCIQCGQLSRFFNQKWHSIKQTCVCPSPKSCHIKIISTFVPKKIKQFERSWVRLKRICAPPKKGCHWGILNKTVGLLGHGVFFEGGGAIDFEGGPSKFISAPPSIAPPPLKKWPLLNAPPQNMQYF